MTELYNQLELNSGASDQAIDDMLGALGTPLPQDYLEFLRTSNGCIGKGPDLFVILDAVEKIHAFTVGDGKTKCERGLVILGGDGCGNIIGIDARSHDPRKMSYVVVDAAWLDLDSASCQYKSMTFDGILNCLAGRS